MMIAAQLASSLKTRLTDAYGRRAAASRIFADFDITFRFFAVACFSAA